jgi:ubiquinone/menaquinone biosynthesis C-methylase UbiE
MKLNLGCGSQTPDGWVNVDYGMGARFLKIPFFSFLNSRLKFFDLDWGKRIFLHDLRKRFPWDNDSVDIIYTSHTLEHFSREDGLNFLKRCHRVLKRGGIFRVVVPDLSFIISEYLKGNIGADYFVERLGVLCDSYTSSFKSKLAVFIQFPHKCMYDTRTLKFILEDIGFKSECKSAFESKIPDIEKVELIDRTKDAVIIEAEK